MEFQGPQPQFTSHHQMENTNDLGHKAVLTLSADTLRSLCSHGPDAQTLVFLASFSLDSCRCGSAAVQTAGVV